MSDFVDHHNLNDMKLPKREISPHELFTFILDLMASSMGNQKREEIIKELEEYKLGLPSDLV